VRDRNEAHIKTATPEGMSAVHVKKYCVYGGGRGPPKKGVPTNGGNTRCV